MPELKMKINLASIMVEAANTCKTPCITYAFQIANGCFARLAKRAIELKDAQLIEELITLGYITPTSSS